MANNHPRLSLRAVLAIDAATCSSMGLLLIAAAGPVASMTGIDPALLLWAGIVLIPTAAYMAFFACRSAVPAWAATLAVLGNAVWVLLSIALPATGLIQPTALGWAFLIAQAFAVALLAWLEHNASRHDAKPA